MTGQDGAHERIQKFLSLEEQVETEVTTMQVMHTEAFTKAARAACSTADGKVDMKRLDDGNAQRIFTDMMVQQYVDGTKAAYGHNEPGNVLMRDLWLQSYAGLNAGSISKMVREKKAKYTLSQHMDMTVLAEESITTEIAKNMRSSAIAAAGLTDADKGSIVGYMGADKFLDAEKVTLDQAVSLLRVYRKEGLINPHSIDHWPAYKKPAADSQRAA